MQEEDSSAGRASAIVEAGCKGGSECSGALHVRVLQRGNSSAGMRRARARFEDRGRRRGETKRVRRTGRIEG